MSAGPLLLSALAIQGAWALLMWETRGSGRECGEPRRPRLASRPPNADNGSTKLPGMEFGPIGCPSPLPASSLFVLETRACGQARRRELLSSLRLLWLWSGGRGCPLAVQCFPGFLRPPPHRGTPTLAPSAPFPHIPSAHPSHLPSCRLTAPVIRLASLCSVLAPLSQTSCL